MENEIWKEIEGYDGDYLISNLGKVKSLKYNKEYILKQGIDGSGYHFVNLYKNNISKMFFVHRLVSKAFIPNPENKPEINHKNGIKSNNQFSNLEWATSSENTKHAYYTGLMENTRKAVKHAWQTGLMKNSKKNAIIAQEAHKKPIYSKKLDLKFESCVEAAKYIQSNYFKNIKLIYLQNGISSLLNNKVTKSKFDYGWKYDILTKPTKQTNGNMH